MIKFTLTVLLIQFPALFIPTVTAANPLNLQDFEVQTLSELKSSNLPEDDVVPPKIIPQPHESTGDDVVPPR